MPSLLPTVPRLDLCKFEGTLILSPHEWHAPRSSSQHCAQFQSHVPHLSLAIILYARRAIPGWWYHIPDQGSCPRRLALLICLLTIQCPTASLCQFLNSHRAALSLNPGIKVPLSYWAVLVHLFLCRYTGMQRVKYWSSCYNLI